MNDVQGWDKARWGMTEEEIIEVFKGEAVKLKERAQYCGWYASVEIEKIDIRGHSFKVHFLMDNASGTLQGINLIAMAIAKTREEGNVIFDQLERALLEKYGPASFKESARSVTWSFPTTIISLTDLTMVTLPVNITICYRPSNKDRI